MADKIRMDFSAVEDMITALATGKDETFQIWERLDGCEKAIKNGAMEGRAGESLTASYERLTWLLWDIHQNLEEMEKDVTKARDEMREATKDSSFGPQDGGE
jgi:hypothetical protein